MPPSDCQREAVKKVLIVSPNWPPVAYPDMQRARMACAHLREFGWEPLILSADPDEQVGPKDALLAKTLPEDLRSWQAKAIPKALTRLIGIQSVGYRSFFHIARLGSQLIARERVDVVFFSTTMFMLFALGPYWKWKHRVPFVLDFQDPWVSDYQVRSGGFWMRCKRFLTQASARILEPLAVRAAAHIVCVSPSYPDMIRRRYPDVPKGRFTVIPFAASERDFEILDAMDAPQSIYDPCDGCVHWVYAGRGGSDMAFSLRAFLKALAAAREGAPGRFERVRVHFIGTDYAAGADARKTVEPIARECGVADLVREYPARIGYFSALKCLRQADALFVPGSSDASYTASKIYPYILARKPLLGVFHEQSSVVEVFRSMACGELVTFRTGESVDSVARRIGDRWFGPVAGRPSATNWDKFDSYSARSMTRVVSEVLTRAAFGD